MLYSFNWLCFFILRPKFRFCFCSYFVLQFDLKHSHLITNAFVRCLTCLFSQFRFFSIKYEMLNFWLFDIVLNFMSKSAVICVFFGECVFKPAHAFTYSKCVEWTQQADCTIELYDNAKHLRESDNPWSMSIKQIVLLHRDIGYNSVIKCIQNVFYSANQISKLKWF